MYSGFEPWREMKKLTERKWTVSIGSEYSVTWNVHEIFWSLTPENCQLVQENCCTITVVTLCVSVLNMLSSFTVVWWDFIVSKLGQMSVILMTMLALSLPVTLCYFLEVRCITFIPSVVIFMSSLRASPPS